MITKKTLIPPDTNQCQAEHQVGAFAMGGQIGKRTRCTKVPVTIATEVEPGDDGLRGSMSLCAKCWRVCVEYKGAYFASYEPVDGYE